MGVVCSCTPPPQSLKKLQRDPIDAERFFRGLVQTDELRSCQPLREMSSVQRRVNIAAREPDAHQRATIWSIVSPCASRRDLVQPSGHEATSSSARSDRARGGAASKFRTEGTNFFLRVTNITG